MNQNPMESHEDFVARLLAAPQDISLPILTKLLQKGYTTTTWHTSASATDAPCISMDAEIIPLADLLSGLAHKAPIYERTHVSCRCFVTVTCSDPKKAKRLKPINVSAFGIMK